MDDIKWYKKPEMIVAFSALFISLITTIVGIYSAYVDREYARASVWPRLVMYYDMAQAPSYAISNRGTGPAIIKYAKIKDGTNNIHYWGDISGFPDSFIQSHISGMTLPANESMKAVSLAINSQSEETKKFRESTQSLTIELCYCSIYDECWLLNRMGEPKPIDKCEISDDEKFLQ